MPQLLVNLPACVNQLQLSYCFAFREIDYSKPFDHDRNLRFSLSCNDARN